MNKKEVERFIPIAYHVLKNNKRICTDNQCQIPKALQSNIASFGAAIAMGNLLSAVAFFSKQGQAAQPRDELMNVIFNVLKEDEKENKDIKQATTLFQYICEHIDQEIWIKEKVINAAIAVKLSMNLFDLIDEKEDSEG